MHIYAYLSYAYIYYMHISMENNTRRNTQKNWQILIRILNQQKLTLTLECIHFAVTLNIVPKVDEKPRPPLAFTGETSYFVRNRHATQVEPTQVRSSPVGGASGSTDRGHVSDVTSMYRLDRQQSKLNTIEDIRRLDFLEINYLKNYK